MMADHLATIAKKEKINITRSALELLARSGGGSFRDSIGYLDQLSAESGKIDEDKVRQLLGLPSAEQTETLLSYVSAGNLKLLIESLNGIQMQGVNAAELAVALSDVLRQKIISGDANSNTPSLLKDLLEVKSSSRPQEFLEVTLLDYATRQAASKPQPDPPQSHNESDYQPEVAPKVKRDEATESLDIVSTEFSIEKWDKVVIAAKSRAASIYTALKLAEPKVDKHKLVLQFKFPLHQKKLNQAKNKELISRLIKDMYGQEMGVECIVNKDLKPKAVTDNMMPAENMVVSSISNIFGSAETIEA
jgi:DNA polymerase III gamma/tau subunit